MISSVDWIKLANLRLPRVLVGLPVGSRAIELELHGPTTRAVPLHSHAKCTDAYHIPTWIPHSIHLQITYSNLYTQRRSLYVFGICLFFSGIVFIFALFLLLVQLFAFVAFELLVFACALVAFIIVCSVWFTLGGRRCALRHEISTYIILHLQRLPRTDVFWMSTMLHCTNNSLYERNLCYVFSRWRIIAPHCFLCCS